MNAPPNNFLIFMHFLVKNFEIHELFLLDLQDELLTTNAKL